MQSRRWRKRLVFAAGLLIMGTFFAIPHLPAQTKGDPKSEPKTVGKAPVFIQEVHVGASGHEQIAYINEMVEKQWKDNKVTPSERCTDYEFIRRASLDLVGRIAKPAEISEYMGWPANRRRSMLVEKLLDSSEFPTNWSNIWTTLMLTRQGIPKNYQKQFNAWLEDKLSEKHDPDSKTKRVIYTPDWSQIVTEILTAKGQTNDGPASYILAHVGEAATKVRDEGMFDFVPVTSRTTRLFLGLRTQCVQCHDHPFNGEWEQRHFWGVNAFFRQTSAPNGRPVMMAKKKAVKDGRFTLEDNPGLNSKGLVGYERRSGILLFTDPTFLDGTKIDLTKIDATHTRRAELAKLITKSPFFAKAYVNRTWGHFFGRSFTKDAVDDFGEHNPASNPELLDRLAKDWAEKYNHDPKHLMRWICNSRAYGLSSIANKTNDKVEDEVLFSRMLLKALTPEQLFESLMVATNAKVAQSKESRQALREDWLNKLVVNFGNDEGEEGGYSGTVVQALLLMNGADINKAIMAEKEGTVAAVLRKHAANKNAAKEAMKDLFMAALNRPPTVNEYNKFLSPKIYALPKASVPNQQVFWTGYYQDIFWALLNSNEFILNH
jgi:hypothetical protein